MDGGVYSKGRVRAALFDYRWWCERVVRRARARAQAWVSLRLFERLLRLDGKFEGDLVSTGDLIVGPRGELVGDVRDMADLVVFGKVIGNINVDHLELCGAASIYGDVTCKTLLMDPTVVLVGTLNVNTFAPNLMDRHGDEVPPEGAGVVPNSPPTSPAKPAEAPAAAPATPRSLRSKSRSLRSKCRSTRSCSPQTCCTWFPRSPERRRHCCGSRSDSRSCATAT